ncbi:hypothetical protein LY76DRAFT_223866 [Colletotrichum caudatum]|nr:hypothetical protein LY76DRAFT_223866 [Colletotrichum caudatum]
MSPLSACRFCRPTDIMVASDYDLLGKGRGPRGETKIPINIRFTFPASRKLTGHQGPFDATVAGDPSPPPFFPTSHTSCLSSPKPPCLSRRSIARVSVTTAAGTPKTPIRSPLSRTCPLSPIHRMQTAPLASLTCLERHIHFTCQMRPLVLPPPPLPCYTATSRSSSSLFPTSLRLRQTVPTPPTHQERRQTPWHPSRGGLTVYPPPNHTPVR